MAKEESQTDEIPQQIGGEEAPSSIEVFFEKNKKPVLFGSVILVIAVFAWIILDYQNKSSQEKAAQAFSDANTIADYDDVARDHQGTVAAGNALLMKADLEFKEGKVKESQATLTSFITVYQDHPRYLQGLLALGVQAQARGNFEEAERYYQQVIDSEDSADIAPLALIRKGDIAYAKGKYEDARGIYQSVTATYPDTPFSYKVQQKMRRDELIKPPPAPPTPPVPSQASVPLIPNPAELKTPPAGQPAPPVSTVSSKPIAIPSPAAKALATPPVPVKPPPPVPTPVPQPTPVTPPKVTPPPPAKPLPQTTSEPVPLTPKKAEPKG